MGALAILKHCCSKCQFTFLVRLRFASRVFDLRLPFLTIDLRGRHNQAVSLVGAAYLFNVDAGVLK